MESKRDMGMVGGVLWYLAWAHDEHSGEVERLLCKAPFGGARGKTASRVSSPRRSGKCLTFLTGPL